jgi:putative holliday junction resolvase
MSDEDITGTGGGHDAGEPQPSAADARPFPRGRVMAVDYGERRIGLALSDPMGIIASPAGNIVRRRGKRPPIAEIIRRAEASGTQGFVVGLPLDGNGDDTPRSLEARRIADELGRRTGLPVRMADERFTTAAARRAIHEMGGTPGDRRGDVDALAATVLLQGVLGVMPR